MLHTAVQDKNETCKRLLEVHAYNKNVQFKRTNQSGLLYKKTSATLSRTSHKIMWYKNSWTTVNTVMELHIECDGLATVPTTTPANKKNIFYNTSPQDTGREPTLKQVGMDENSKAHCAMTDCAKKRER